MNTHEAYPHRVLVCGGRNYSDSMALDSALTRLAQAFGQYVVICGGARGADELAARWALRIGRPVIQMPAAWDALGRKAGHVRNRWMLDLLDPTYVVAFPGGAGTVNMSEQAEARGLPV